MRALSETGIVGFALLAGLVAAAVAVAASALRRAAGAQRTAAAGLAAAASAYLVHSLVDMTWDFVAVTAPVLAALGALAAAGSTTEPRPRRRFLAAFAVGAVVLSGVASLASPQLAERRTRAAIEALLRREPIRAERLAADARALNPLAVQPLHVAAAAEEQQGRLREARELYVRAVELQPENPETWYELGRFELDVSRNSISARRYLERSRRLDRTGPAASLLASLRAER